MIDIFQVLLAALPLLLVALHHLDTEAMEVPAHTKALQVNSNSCMEVTPEYVPVK